MKRNVKIVISVVILMIVIGTAFFAGSYVKEKEYMESREQRCLKF